MTMDVIVPIFSFVYQYLDNIGFLVLTAIGLIMIFGMMGVINMAHGELMMIGAFTMAFSVHSGIPIPIAVILAGLSAAVAGIILERLVIRHFYKQLLSSLVVTWGLSLILSQGFLLIFGPAILNVRTPLGAFGIGETTYSYYRLVLFIVAMALVAAVWALLRYSSLGVRARATMEDPAMAEALGVRTSRVYSITFGIGAALGGIAGAMFGMTAQISAFFGADYTPLAFITVVVGGGASIVVGILSSAFYLGGVQTVVTTLSTVYIGYVAVMAAALIALLLMPRGISDWLENRKLRRQAADRDRG